MTSTRIGVAYAGPDALLPWRTALDNVALRDPKPFLGTSDNTGAKINVIAVPFSDLYQKVLTDEASAIAWATWGAMIEPPRDTMPVRRRAVIGI